MSSCTICINHDLAGTLQRVKVCYNSVEVTSIKNIVDGAVIADPALEADALAFIRGEAIPSGATVTQRENCVIDSALITEEVCLGDGTTPVVKARVQLKVDLETELVVDALKVTVTESVDPALPVGTTTTNVTYTSGTVETGDLALTVEGNAVQQTPCLECIGC